MTKVIVVGNGPSVLDKPLGHMIDQFSTVVRINNYRTKGLEAHTGSRTDLWVRNIARNVPLGEQSGRTLIVPPPWVFHLTPLRYSLLWRLSRRTWRLFHPDKLRDHYSLGEVLAAATIVEAHSCIGVDTCGAPWLSTGAIAVYHLAMQESRITVHGFDHLDPSKQHHYFSPAGVPAKTKHASDLERKLFQFLMDHGKIERLSQ